MKETTLQREHVYSYLRVEPYWRILQIKYTSRIYYKYRVNDYVEGLPQGPPSDHVGVGAMVTCRTATYWRQSRTGGNGSKMRLEAINRDLFGACANLKLEVLGAACQHAEGATVLRREGRKRAHVAHVDHLSCLKNLGRVLSNRHGKRARGEVRHVLEPLDELPHVRLARGDELARQSERLAIQDFR